MKNCNNLRNVTTSEITIIKAMELYSKLKNKWGLQIVYDYEGYSIRSIIKGNFIYSCFWMPELKQGFERPTFDDFLDMYNIVFYDKDKVIDLLLKIKGDCPPKTERQIFCDQFECKKCRLDWAIWKSKEK